MFILNSAIQTCPFSEKIPKSGWRAHKQTHWASLGVRNHYQSHLFSSQLIRTKLRQDNKKATSPAWQGVSANLVDRLHRKCQNVLSWQGLPCRCTREWVWSGQHPSGTLFRLSKACLELWSATPNTLDVGWHGKFPVPRISYIFFQSQRLKCENVSIIWAPRIPINLELGNFQVDAISCWICVALSSQSNINIIRELSVLKKRGRCLRTG
jgi:hypothetical protein